MSIVVRLYNFLRRFSWFNPHLMHGFQSGPDRSYFWIALEWEHSYAKNRGRALRDPARTTHAGLLDHLCTLQRYKLLRAATYKHFPSAITVADQLECAYTYVLSEINKAVVRGSREQIGPEFKGLVCTATKMAFESISDEFKKGLKDELKNARFETDYRVPR